MNLGGRLRFGPYRARGVIASGAMGIVYRAEHVDTGAQVALKRVARVTGSVAASIRREIHALGRVRHPGVVRLLDQGTTEGLPWYAMELLDGTTLRELLRRHRAESAGILGTGPPIEATAVGTGASVPGAPVRGAPAAGHLLPLIAALCEPLSVVHASGLVHRDLKPDNVVVVEDSAGMRPVLVDFGIAAGFVGESGRETLDAAGQASGTLGYMAPEQIRGELLDARADLYALGCILYECVVGHPPFVGGSARDILEQHLAASPPLPSSLGVQLHPGLEHLIVRLLGKRPAERPGTAGAVALALHELGHGAPRQAVVSGEGNAARGETYLYRAPLTGRDALLDRARELLDALARSRTGGAMFLVGESGAGKTRFGLELLQHASRTHLQVIAGQCRAPSSEQAIPLAPLAPFMRTAIDRCIEGGAEVGRRLLGARGAILLPYFPDLATLPEIASAPEPVSLKAEAARARVLDSLVAVLLAFAAEVPFVLFLDDMHWGDELTLELLARLAPDTLARAGISCIVTYRGEETNDLLERLATRNDSADSIRLDLPRLDEEAVGAMVSGMLAVAHVPRPWVTFLTGVSAGNPYFLTEYLRAAVDAGMLARDAGGRWSLDAAFSGSGEALPLPTTIGALLERRIEGLGDAERAFLSAAAALDRQFEGEIAAAIARLGESAALDAVSTLQRRQILEESERGELRFVHDRIREVAYARLTPDERREIHGRAAALLEARHSGDPEQHASLARHHAGAGHHGAAATYFVSAARRAESAYAHAQAIDFYRAAIRESEHVPDASPSRAELWAKVGEIFHRAGHPAESCSAYGEALALVDDSAGLARASILRRRGMTWDTRQVHAEALDDYARAEEALGGEREQSAAWWHEWVQIQLLRISIHYWAADQGSLRAAIDRVLPAIDTRGTDAQRARFFVSLVQRDLRAQRYRVTDQTVEYARRGLAAFERTDEVEDTAQARFSLGFVLLMSDDPTSAVPPMLAALAEAERLGSIALKARCLSWLAVCRRRQGDVGAAVAVAGRCIEAAREVGMIEYLASAEANLGWAALCRGDLEGARALCHSALSRWQSHPFVFSFQWLARLPLVSLALKRSDLEEARAHASALLDPAQQALPEILQDPVIAAGHGDVAMLARTVLVAEQSGFL